jgi:hypothetical protein
MATIKVANKAKLLGGFIGSNLTGGPVPLTSIPKTKHRSQPLPITEAPVECFAERRCAKATTVANEKPVIVVNTAFTRRKHMSSSNDSDNECVCPVKSRESSQEQSGRGKAGTDSAFVCDLSPSANDRPDLSKQGRAPYFARSNVHPGIHLPLANPMKEPLEKRKLSDESMV